MCGGGRLDAVALPVQIRCGWGARPKGARVGAGRQRTIVSLSRLISYAVVAGRRSADDWPIGHSIERMMKVPLFN